MCYLRFRVLLSLILKNDKLSLVKCGYSRSTRNHHYFLLNRSYGIFLPAVRDFCVSFKWLRFLTVAANVDVNKPTDGNNDVQTPVVMKTIYKYTTSINHEDLVTLLNNCSSVMEQIEQMCSSISLSEEEKNERLELAKILQNILNPYFPNCKIILVGSSINGLGLKGCDVDLVFFTKWNPEMWVKGLRGTQLPTVDEVDNGSVPASILLQFSPKLQLRFARRVLTKYFKTLSSTIRLVAGRCPTLQFQYGSRHSNCDLAFGVSNSSVLSTKLLLFCGHLDKRVLPLAKIISYWAKHRELIGPLDKFKSYAFSLLLIYFLQTRNPPVLPSIENILNQTEFFNDGHSWDYNLSQDIVKFSPSTNTQTIDDLLKDFFVFYLFFDFTHHFICPLKGQSFWKKDSSMLNKEESQKLELCTTICIQDPFDEKWNVTTGTAFKYCRALMVDMLFACQSSSKWTPVMNQTWGLASLLEKNSHRKMTGENYVDFSIGKSAICSLSKVSENILKIFNHALLFKCDVIKVAADFDSHLLESNHFSNVIFRNEETTNGGIFDPVLKLIYLMEKKMNATVPKQPLLKMLCTTSNTWQGRWHWKHYFTIHNNKNLLELEHLVSQQLVNSVCDKDIQPFQFLCYCVPNPTNSCLQILLFPVNRDKFPLNVAVFLKEYIPKLIVNLD